MGDSNGLALTATPSSTGTWTVGVSFISHGIGKSSLPLSGWHNLAVTCVDGGQTLLYLDGTLILQDDQAEVLSMTATSLQIAGNHASSGSFQPFSGWVQNVTLWDVPLPGEDIQACLLPWFPLQDIDPLATCDFTAQPPLDVVSGESIALTTKIWEAVGEVVEGTLTADSIIALLKAINDGSGLTAFVKALLDNVSWWDFLWMVARVLLELLGLLVPELEEALILAKCRARRHPAGGAAGPPAGGLSVLMTPRRWA